jgi:hypothetical protein
MHRIQSTAKKNSNSVERSDDYLNVKLLHRPLKSDYAKNKYQSASRAESNSSDSRPLV